jgi:hypothetical protein
MSRSPTPSSSSATKHSTRQAPATAHACGSLPAASAECPSCYATAAMPAQPHLEA